MFTNKNLLNLAIRQAIVAIGAILIAVAVWWFLSAQINTTSDAILKNRETADNFDQRTELLFSLKQDSVLVGQNDVLIDNALLDSDDILEFTDALENISTRYKIAQTFAFDTPVPPSFSTPIKLSAIDYNAKITANVSTFKNYLVDFEKLPYFSKINGITITTQDKAGWENNSSVSFDATLFTKATQ